MKPVYFQEFVDLFSKILSSNEEFVALAAGGSWVEGRMDRFSDIDLVIVHNSETISLLEKRALAQSAGELLACFTGEHVGEPRLLICLYNNPMLHVDLKFVHLPDMSIRVEDPVVIWERDYLLTNLLKQSGAEFPFPDFQWIEDRFWVWIHYAATKIGRGEFFEATTFLSFIQQNVLGPLALIKNNELPKGVRKIEMLLPNDDLEFMKSTMAEHNRQSCLTALRNAVQYYTVLRESVMPASNLRNQKAEEAVMTYLSEISESGNLKQ
ncbi:aminoglycoside 6-adenylyltransferase [Dyadobacter subterraneus]|uniref:Nucleotidyltransferase domain-containing protein n=1 Tax=Dyadobacter subterraneus TaxID=2773304 RepID=A0ABR9WCX9_9BACT|nr:aminoglycoside 6-adenylyltransferase [Dyadobacter subterraneus]MBE9463342.1 nucleotidyltransferase domain-containing protein [Dyadobacter subterraneus]